MRTLFMLIETAPVQIGVIVMLVIVLASIGPLVLGAVLIHERQVGIVTTLECKSPSARSVWSSPTSPSRTGMRRRRVEG